MKEKVKMLLLLWLPGPTKKSCALNKEQLSFRLENVLFKQRETFAEFDIDAIAYLHWKGQE